MRRAKKTGVVVYDFAAYRTARLLLEQHGKQAVSVVASRVEAMQTQGDDASHVAWLGILDAVWEMSRKQAVSRAGAAA
ncbi:MAG: hypothetical protein EXQ87_03805 [Alphaproteobacteria bacterium]|nr:hypothetical protein [Alphaproteobacteria bacterium]